MSNKRKLIFTSLYGIKHHYSKEEWRKLKNELIDEFGNENKLVRFKIWHVDYNYKLRKKIAGLLGMLFFAHLFNKVKEHENKKPGTKSDLEKGKIF